MKVDVRWLVLALPLLALVASCSGDELPLCADVSWLDRSNPAELTGAPTFSASQIAPGDPIAVLVPVSEHTLEVRVSIRSADDASGTSVSKETDSDEIVELPLEDTNLAAGVYRARFIQLSGDVLPDDTSYRDWDNVSDVAMTYIIGVSFAAESVDHCLSNIPVATFEVVGD